MKRFFSSKFFASHFEKIDATKGKLNIKPFQFEKRPIPNVKSIFLVSSGKGGVGKSTVSVNLALAFSITGKRVGLLDADIFGPSIPNMMNLNDKKVDIDDKGRFIPLENYGIQCMSMGFLVDSASPVVWRGLMLTKALNQLLFQVRWDETDVLVIDLPPGTGDVPISICQSVNVTGAVIVSTPQDVSLLDVRKGVSMFDKVKVPVLGLIENMSYFSCPHCKERTNIFRKRGETLLSKELEGKIGLLGEIPLAAEVCEAMDTGKPIVMLNPKSKISQIYIDIANKLL